eukprot:TRINITY_DN589_c0_g1_i3.p1 TRINITY_DN589_c0_g1~~TRINITY_DN589_c0_g1_i3.p1  ORF type:complete len:362 (+),score=49.12 TRINITY_DN589_c0_g1_i3:86-1171(+)
MKSIGIFLLFVVLTFSFVGLSNGFVPGDELVRKTNFLKSFHELVSNVSNSVSIDFSQASIGDAPACEKCMSEGSKWVMKDLEIKMERVCKVTKCPFLADLCKKLKGHRGVAEGMIIFTFKPMWLASAYCHGKGACTAGEADVIDIADFSDAAAIADLNNSVKPVGKFSKQSFESLEKQVDVILGEGGLTQGIMKELTPAALELEGSPDGECDHSNNEQGEEDNKHCKCMCKFCIKESSVFIMKEAVEKVEEICRSTTSPKFKAFCVAAKTNCDVAFGYLVAKVEPWKFGIGFCQGVGACAWCHHHHNHHLDDSELLLEHHDHHHHHHHPGTNHHHPGTNHHHPGTNHHHPGTKKMMRSVFQ